VHGNVLEALREGRLQIGPQVLLEPGVWITAPGDARVTIGGGTFLNLGVMIAADELVEIGEHCMFANGCFITDASHRFDDPHKPVPWQGFTSKGPTRIGDNVWCGANVVITGGVTIGQRCVIGANAVVTADVPPFSVAAGVPAKVLRTIEYPEWEISPQICPDISDDLSGQRRSRASPANPAAATRLNTPASLSPSFAPGREIAGELAHTTSVASSVARSQASAHQSSGRSRTAATAWAAANVSQIGPQRRNR